MFIDSPKNVLKRQQNTHDLDDSGLHFLLKMRAESARRELEFLRTKPSAAHYAEAAEHLTMITEVVITSEQAANILDLYPKARILLVEFDGTADTLVRDELAFAAAHFFLGCSWPLFRDGVDVDAFTALLKKQAVRMGYQESS